VGGGDRLETSIVAHGTSVAFMLGRATPETKRSMPTTDHTERLRLSILDVHGLNSERIAWEDSEELALEAQITDIVVELITTAEMNHRDICIRRHLWMSEKRETLQKRLEKEKASAEAAARAYDVAIGKARKDDLLGMATDYRKARTVRLFVSAMRHRFDEVNRIVTQTDFEDWCDWALAQADDLDPAKNLEGLLKSGRLECQ
jgi:hypothetical protein